jgi:hypothetical protein
VVSQLLHRRVLQSLHRQVLRISAILKNANIGVLVYYHSLI